MPDDASRPPLRSLDGNVEAPFGDTLYEDTPQHLLRPLREWLVDYLRSQSALSRRVALRLRIGSPSEQSTNPETARSRLLASAYGLRLLNIVTTVLQLDDQLSIEVSTEGYEQDPNFAASAAAADLPDWLADGWGWMPHCTRGPQVERLSQILDDAGSAYTVCWSPIPVHLTRRVDPTVIATAKQAMAADPTAGALLAKAWSKVYGLEIDHDVDGAYHLAIRAVEQIVCPLVQPAQAANGRATLGTVLGELGTSQGPHWKFVIGKLGTDDVVPIIEMARRLWEGQASRHGGGSNSRPQTLDEARAAVHLAVYLVHAFSSGAVTRRTP